MIDYFFWGYTILLAATLIFYLVFFSLIWYWHERKATVVIVPLIFTFEFFAVGFFVVSLICLVLQYLPDILFLINNISQR